MKYYRHKEASTADEFLAFGLVCENDAAPWSITGEIRFYMNVYEGDAGLFGIREPSVTFTDTSNEIVYKTFISWESFVDSDIAFFNYNDQASIRAYFVPDEFSDSSSG